MFVGYGVDNQRSDMTNEPSQPGILKYQDEFSATAKDVLDGVAGHR